MHPESVLTPDGPHLLSNFLRLAGEGDAGRLDAETGSFATRGMAEAGDVARDRARPWTTMACTSSGDIEPSTSSRRTSAWV